MNFQNPVYRYAFLVIYFGCGFSGLPAQEFLSESPESVALIDITTLDSSLVLDIRYATEDNFTGKIMYDCGKCYLREPVARLLVEAQQDFRKMGYRIKLFDCYRPRPIQYKLWEAVPDPRYVAQPDKGSVHNRGGAVDLTLIDENGKELDMGTAYDFFGERAHQDYTDLPEGILKNRAILKETLKKYQFAPIRTEWWHFDYQKNKLYPLSDLVWDCN